MTDSSNILPSPSASFLPSTSSSPNATPSTNILPSGSVIGLIGGGQLARMLAIAAAELGFRTVVFCPEPDCPAAQTTNDHIVSPYDDYSALDHFISLCDVVTYEFENLSLQTVQYIERTKHVYPSSKALEITQDRLFEKQFLQEIGIRTALWHAVDNHSSLLLGLSALGGRGLLKTRRFGYDGKNQMMLNHPKEEAIEEAFTIFEGQPSILEEIVPFLSEISVLSARTKQGNHIFYDCPENQHKNGILHKSFVPSRVPLSVQKAAQEISVTVMDALNYVGVLCIEFFVLMDGTLLVNELAPRVHNSGHWTQKACVTSQFEQHIRALCGLPLGSTYRHSNCEMINLLGSNLNDFKYFLTQERTSVHLYGKNPVRSTRKMGHVIQLTGPVTKSEQ
ncbi:5-(carboxyamino)imidazole ribonucleotide synthase [Bartonella quintana]|uniref:N5-carboxyaminoimidazole ribonucleotide synthase n=2 Tax=Bartonella quintana TaxID=803 RepID=W3U1G3_BARQI|nr:5-(carboxyamino)imidazole ribonucleotide synthase [Bartonella quintana]ETS12481.1 phosphoribosylaminoimidazole carboxylase, ATPase subunit [Bartonella quintana BQ2-D70]ETS15064.1 phosphoribosylaminoimidazole carboxylase, ATPase subunit [Bartonella quintana JK 73rel]ETS17407.1 phosphoribosylaminoimidazole carboxylase, ATPase subunit [Bartonella quintana JK 73]ETS17415.1 phosphoribosylaminoimidazole carboxylase, ATPase subunit [Bartonella quintana JK 12]ETS19500.1 phosphoribosylaminoimidazole